jgi:hypothetical protein
MYVYLELVDFSKKESSNFEIFVKCYKIPII